MKRLKFIITLLISLSCIFLFVSQKGFTSVEKIQHPFHKELSTTLTSDQHQQGIEVLSSDIDVTEDNFSSSALGLIHFDSDSQSFTANPVEMISKEIYFTKETNIPLYILYHSQKAHLS